MKAPHILVGGVLVGLLAGAALTGFAISNFGGAGPQAEQARSGGRPGGARGGYAPVVAMGTAKADFVARTVSVIGEARALKSVVITAEATGIVEEVVVAPGARVAKGDLLLQINDDEQQVALVRARANFPIARDNAARYRDLASDEAASALEAEEAQNAFIAARADLRAAEVAVAQRRILAPFDGIVGLIDSEAGDYIQAGGAVTTLDDTSSVIIDFAVPQEAAGFINIGQTVEAAMTSAAERTYRGEITAIDSRVDPASRSLRAEATFVNVDGRLIPGAVFTVSTTAEGEPAISIPGLAVQWDRSGAYVWRRNAEGAAEQASVVILQRRDDIVVVEGDIAAGDAIVVEGADRVRRGLPLPQVEPDGGTGVSAASSVG